MSFAGVKFLAGVVMVGAIVAAIPQAANAQSCNTGALGLAGMQAFSFNLDPSQMAAYTLDSPGTDLAMIVTDDQQNVACQTQLAVTGHLSCSWMPVSGATYTVTVMRPASPDAIAAAETAAATPVSASGDGESTAAGGSNGIGGPAESFDLCQQSSE